MGWKSKLEFWTYLAIAVWLALSDLLAYFDSYAWAVAIVLPGQQIVLEATQTGCWISTD